MIIKGDKVIKYSTEKFEKYLSEWNLYLSERQKEQFIKYYELLKEWNGFMNLTAITDYDEVVVKHFTDSLSAVKVFDFEKCEGLIDIGTGAGFPGIPLKIMFPDTNAVLIDSLNKRVSFLQEVTQKLDLKGVELIHGRAEETARRKEYRESFDVCLSRAVANLSTLSELCLPFVKIGGSFISYKSEKVREEIIKADNAVGILGGGLIKEEKFMLPDTDIYRELIVIKKIVETPRKYPRKPGIPAKDPIN